LLFLGLVSGSYVQRLADTESGSAVIEPATKSGRSQENYPQAVESAGGSGLHASRNMRARATMGRVPA
jgi:hypothetical protein